MMVKVVVVYLFALIMIMIINDDVVVDAVAVVVS